MTRGKGWNSTKHFVRRANYSASSQPCIPFSIFSIRRWNLYVVDWHAENNSRIIYKCHSDFSKQKMHLQRNKLKKKDEANDRYIFSYMSASSNEAFWLHSSKNNSNSSIQCLLWKIDEVLANYRSIYLCIFISNKTEFK